MDKSPTKVSYESLNVLAALAITGVHYPKLRAADNIPDGVLPAVSEFFSERLGENGGDDYVSGLSRGTELGLEIAAHIVTHGFDADAVREAVGIALNQVVASRLEMRMPV